MNEQKQLVELLQESDERMKSEFDNFSQRLNGLEGEMTELYQKGTKAPAPTGHKSGGSIREALQKSAGLDRMRKGETKNSDPINLKGVSVKTLTSLQGSTGSPGEGIDVQSEREGGLFGHALRRTTIFDALQSRPIASNALTFTRMSNFSNAADTQSGEGTTKAEQDITPALITAPVETIAVHHTASKQVLEDEPGLESSVSILLGHGVREKAERQIVNGAGSAYEMSGLITEGTTFVPTVAPMADRIGECAATMGNSGYEAGVVLLNPVDWFKIRSERAAGGDEQYVGPGWAAPVEPAVYGVPAVASAAVPQGTAIVIDTRYVMLLDRQETTVEFSRETGDNFKQNLVTVLAEMRLGLACLDTFAVQVIDLNGTV